MFRSTTHFFAFSFSANFAEIQKSIWSFRFNLIFFFLLQKSVLDFRALISKQFQLKLNWGNGYRVQGVYGTIHYN